MRLRNNIMGFRIIAILTLIVSDLAALESGITKATCDDDCGLHGLCLMTLEGSGYCECDGGFVFVIYQGCVIAVTLSHLVVPGSSQATPSHSPTSSTRNSTALTVTTTIPSPATEATTLYPIKERTCAPGFLCLHGQCALDTIGCQCDEGWSGVFCHEKCTKNCTTHGRCMIHVDGTSYCSCGWLYQGEFCEEEKTAPPTHPIPTPSHNVNDTTSTPTVVFFITDANATKDAPGTEITMAALTTTATDSLRSLEQRTCLPGFVCVHGRCSNTLAMACECDAGWEGVLCHNPCLLNCGHYNNHSPDVDVTPSSSVDGSDATVVTPKPGLWNSTVPGNHTLSERECVVGFECLYGVCKKGGIECVCDPGYTGTLCHLPCPRTCVHGECDSGNYEVPRCKCQPDWTGVNCTEPRPVENVDIPHESIAQWYIVGACAALLLILLVVSVAFPYWMWKRGHLLIMRIIYHFKSFEDDGREVLETPGAVHAQKEKQVGDFGHLSIRQRLFSYLILPINLLQDGLGVVWLFHSLLAVLNRRSCVKE